MPFLEYSCVVWDGCTAQDINSLQKFQNEAGHIVTGLTRPVALDNLYRECCWVTLAERRRQQKVNITSLGVQNITTRVALC